jgi:hypothetical protein
MSASAAADMPEKMRARDVDLRQPARDAPDQSVGESEDSVGNAG